MGVQGKGLRRHRAVGRRDFTAESFSGGGLRGVTSENSDSRAHEDSEQVQEPTAVRSAVPAELRLVLAAAGTRMRLPVEPIPSPASRGAAERGLA